MDEEISLRRAHCAWRRRGRAEKGKTRPGQNQTWKWCEHELLSLGVEKPVEVLKMEATLPDLLK